MPENQRAQPVDIVLAPAGVLEALTVTASCGASESATPAATSVLAAAALESSPAAMLNDPFGGWVYWDRIPQTALDRVEVVRGATGDLYGADAVGGVIQLLTIPRRSVRARGFSGLSRTRSTACTTSGERRSSLSACRARSGRESASICRKHGCPDRKLDFRL